jgi:NAD(P)-dependent dehydrogenase (short-subunit alcohol dehydrogenase family)
MGRLTDKVAIVTGSGQGIGRGIALAFAAEGAHVILAEIQTDSGRAVEAEILARGEQATFFECDVSQRDSVDACVAQTLAERNRIDVVVNNAVAHTSSIPLIEQTASLFRESFETGLLGSFYFMQASYEALAKRGGSIINLGSAAGYQGHALLAPYSATKEAIRALTRVAAREWGAQGIRANVLCPFGDSPGWQEWRLTDPAGADAFVAARPLSRVGACEEDIGRAAVFLASDESAFVTGMTLPVDGGGAMLG